jgi:Zn-dependent protease with chaperone function
MHTETESVQERLPGIAQSLPAATGLGLYLLTLAVEMLLGASTRWLLIFLVAAIAGPIVRLGPGAEALAWLGAIGPIIISFLAFVLPGRGHIWRRRLGARRPSAEERAAIDDAIALLGVTDASPREPTIYVLDELLPAAAARGAALTLTRGLVESDSLPAAIAHELGHLHSLDSRITEAIDRLAVWEDPLSPGDPSGGATDHETDRSGAVPWAVLCWTLRLAGGGSARRLLAPLWAAYWRSRELAADAHAAALGQAEDLAQHLADFELPLDFGCTTFPFNRSQHPPVALRIERLRAAPHMTVSE